MPEISIDPESGTVRSLLEMLMANDFVPMDDGVTFEAYCYGAQLDHMVRVILNDSEAEIYVMTSMGVNIWGMTLRNVPTRVIAETVKLAIHDAEIR